MKKPIVTFLMILGICSFMFGQAKPTLGVLNIDSKGLQMDPEQLGNLVRLELDKLDLFEVMDQLFFIEFGKFLFKFSQAH